MNNNEINEGNKLIAEFMGGEFFTDIRFGELRVRNLESNKNASRYVYQLRYHTSWDWIMPVVERIRVIENGDGGRYTFNWKDYKVWFSKWQDGSGIISECCMISGTTPIQAIYESVVEFIKWYNEQSKQL